MAERGFNVMRRSAALVAASWVWLVTIDCGSDSATLPQRAAYQAVLSGSSERPVRANGGSGLATLEVDGNHAQYVVTASSLTAPVTIAQIFIGDASAAAGQAVVRLTLTARADTIAMGSIDLSRPITFNTTTISADSLRSLFERGTAYVNVYTATYPGGEMRGQIVRR